MNRALVKTVSPLANLTMRSSLPAALRDPVNIGVMGQNVSMATPSLGKVILIGVILGIASYQVGKAMAPSGADRSTWGWIAVPVGLLTGPLGLGIQGYIANRRRS